MSCEVICVDSANAPINIQGCGLGTMSGQIAGMIIAGCLVELPEDTPCDSAAWGLVESQMRFFPLGDGNKPADTLTSEVVRPCSPAEVTSRTSTYNGVIKRFSKSSAELEFLSRVSASGGDGYQFMFVDCDNQVYGPYLGTLVVNGIEAPGGPDAIAIVNFSFSHKTSGPNIFDIPRRIPLSFLKTIKSKVNFDYTLGRSVDYVSDVCEQIIIGFANESARTLSLSIGTGTLSLATTLTRSECTAPLDKIFVSGLPAGVSASISAQAPGSLTVLFTASAAAGAVPGGPYRVFLTGSTGGKCDVSVVEIKLTVTA